jgi:hypothetical protein
MRKTLIALSIASGLTAVAATGASATPANPMHYGVSTNHASVMQARWDDHHYSRRDVHRYERHDYHRR